MIPLPAWVDQEAWLGFCEMRRKIKKPLTDRAAKLILAELYDIRDAGHCPNAALDQSTLCGYLDVYPKKDKNIQRVGASPQVVAAKQVEEEAEREHALRVSTVDARKVVDMLGAVKSKLTRRA